MLNLIALTAWIQDKLSSTELTIKKLMKFFGFKSEKGQKQSCDSADTDDDDNKADALSVLETESPDKALDKGKISTKRRDETANHGRYASGDYSGCPVINVPFNEVLLKQGLCPECAVQGTQAKIYPEEPTIVVLLEGSPLISGTRYSLEKSRCSVCLTYFTASLPDGLSSREKYSYSCISAIAINHYFAGLPFKRLETLQKLQGVPLADSTQYDLIRRFHNSSVQPIISVLEKKAANGTTMYFDDTPGNIIEQTINNKNTKSNDKRSVHATAMLSRYGEHDIYLFNTNTLTAGKQFASVIENRTEKIDFMTMSDASASNFPVLDEDLLVRWIIVLCLTHSRRKFVDIMSDGDEDAQFVVKMIANIYHNEKHCQKAKLTLEQRLEYHQKHSAPIMDALKIWLNNLILYKNVEPNCEMGKAIIYMLKRWYWLTQFLRVLGAPLDNNICEIAIKVIIRYRKNSLFYKTFVGASIGGDIMSLLHTAAHAGVNIFDYFNKLQQYTEQVQLSPEDWLPWKYKKTVAELQLTPSHHQ